MPTCLEDSYTQGRTQIVFNTTLLQVLKSERVQVNRVCLIIKTLNYYQFKQWLVGGQA